jgi:hypothetical protein
VNSGERAVGAGVPEGNSGVSLYVLVLSPFQTAPAAGCTEVAGLLTEVPCAHEHNEKSLTADAARRRAAAPR